MRRLLMIAGTMVITAACGGSGSSVAPTPQYPNLVGGWNGTHTTAIVYSSGRGSNLCNMTWIINTQNGGQFSGTFQRSGGTTASCADAGTLSGIVSASGQVSGLALNATIGGSSCTRLAGDGAHAGILTGNLLTAQATDRIDCLGLTIDRSLSLSMHKQ